MHTAEEALRELVRVVVSGRGLNLVGDVENTIRTCHLVLGTVLSAQDEKRIAETSSDDR